MDEKRKAAMADAIKKVFGPLIGVYIDSAVLPDTRELATKKGFIVRGAPIHETAAVVMLGRMLYCVSTKMDNGAIKDLLEQEGWTLFPMTSDQMHRGLLAMPDMPDMEAGKKDHALANVLATRFDELTKIAYTFRSIFGTEISKEPGANHFYGREPESDGIDRLVDALRTGRSIHEAMAEAMPKEGPQPPTEEAGEGDIHSLKLHIGAILPDGEVIEAHLCRHCMMEFIEGRSDGRQFAKKELVRLLLAFIVSHADDVAEKNAATTVENGIKASLANVTKH